MCAGDPSDPSPPDQPDGVVADRAAEPASSAPPATPAAPVDEAFASAQAPGMRADRSVSGAAPRLVELGAIVRPHALRGELVVKLFNPGSDLLAAQRELALRTRDGEIRTYQVSSVRGGGEGVLLALSGVVDREQADALRGCLLCVERAQLPALGEGEYYLVDLPGLEVRGPDGAPLGHVEDVIEYPSTSCLVVITSGIVREVPDLPRYLLEVRVEEGFVIVDHLDEIEPARLAALKGKR